ncbi:MAG: hypothetical protein JW954_04855 [Dehalococcoidaceae bacterium]|nr:hypothetical protein [Dehalococcoidaceae bacterium]
MNKHRVILLAINILGGLAVIGSYIYGINAQPGGADALWGGVPENIRLIYTASMFIAAFGYFLFLYYVLVKVNPDEARIGKVSGFSLFHVVFASILLPSAFWMPLTNLYLANQTTPNWAGVILVLAIVGVASLCLAISLLKLKPVAGVTPYRLAVAGSIYFTIHTLVLDAVIWPVLFLQ